MAYHFRGNINGTVVSEAMSLPMVINSFSLVNRAASGVVVNVYLISGASQVAIMPFNQALTVSQMYEGTREVVMLAAEQIKVQTNGSVDYDFTIENLNP